MSLNPITFSLSSAGLGTPLAGSDYISGSIIYSSTTPSGFTTGIAKELFSIVDAENAGIKSDYNDETQATATATLTHGATNDTITLVVTEPNINSTTKIVNLGTYTVLAGDSTSILLATSVAAFINANTYIHGYSASSTGLTGIVTLTARKGLGIALNTLSALTSTCTGTTTCTDSSFSGGVVSKQAIWHYQIYEYFRMQPNGILWLAFFTIPSTYNFIEIETIQNQVGGVIRQFGIYSANGTTPTLINNNIDALQIVFNDMFVNHMPSQCIYSSNMIGITDLSTLTNLQLRTDSYVSVVISQDGGNLGAWLSLTSGASVTNWGACLGTVSLSGVENCIAWRGAFNISDGNENSVLAFANGKLNTIISKGLQSQLDSYNYLFLIYVFGSTGSYWNNDYTAISTSNDFAYISRQRTIQKASRILYTGFTPLVNSNLYTNPDGTLSASSIATFKNAISPSLKQMVIGSILFFGEDSS